MAVIRPDGPPPTLDLPSGLPATLIPPHVTRSRHIAYTRGPRHATACILPPCSCAAVTAAAIRCGRPTCHTASAPSPSLGGAVLLPASPYILRVHSRIQRGGANLSPIQTMQMRCTATVLDGCCPEAEHH